MNYDTLQMGFTMSNKIHSIKCEVGIHDFTKREVIEYDTGLKVLEKECQWCGARDREIISSP